MANPLLIARSDNQDCTLLPALTNRHGLITGATGTGKTVTLQVITEQLASAGVPVFLADVKGDLSGLGAAGIRSEKFDKRLAMLGITDWQPAAFSLQFWDVFGEQGHPLRATISDLGPLLLARLLNLNETQEGVLQLVFRIADDHGLLLLDLKDLRAMVQFVGENARDYTNEYGNISTASIGAIQRGLLTLEEQGGDKFFGEPMLNIADLMQTDAQGRGVVNILAADKLFNAPRLYATALLWLLAELFENLPEVGDRDKPKLVFFFDEAHLLFKDAPDVLLDKIEQVVRLIRSKGVGVYFVSQNPLDLPDTVLGQLGNRVQHALRAFTPRDQKAVKAAAETLPQNPNVDTETAITELGVGEALVTFLDEKGRPTPVERAFILPPASRIGPLLAAERQAAITGSLVYGQYEKPLDRASAYEHLKQRAQDATSSARSNHTATGPERNIPAPRVPAPSAHRQREEDSEPAKPARGRETAAEAFAKSAARAIGSELGRRVLRGLLGSMLGGKKGLF